MLKNYMLIKLKIDYVNKIKNEKLYVKILYVNIYVENKYISKELRYIFS